MKSSFTKTPTEILDYEFDWNEELGGEEDITSSDWSVSGSGLTVVSTTFAAGIVKIRLSDGIDGTRYLVRNIVTKSNGEKPEDWFYLTVKSAA